MERKRYFACQSGGNFSNAITNRNRTHERQRTVQLLGNISNRIGLGLVSSGHNLVPFAVMVSILFLRSGHQYSIPYIPFSSCPLDLQLPIPQAPTAPNNPESLISSVRHTFPPLLDRLPKLAILKVNFLVVLKKNPDPSNPLPPPPPPFLKKNQPYPPPPTHPHLLPSTPTTSRFSILSPLPIPISHFEILTR